MVGAAICGDSTLSRVMVPDQKEEDKLGRPVERSVRSDYQVVIWIQSVF